MAKNNIALSAKGLQLADQISRKDFRFVSGSKALICDRFQAGFISPRIAALILSDPTVDEFSIAGGDAQTLEILHKLIFGESVVITEGNVGLLTALSENLGNVELSELVMKFVDQSEELSVSNAVSRLKQKMKLGVDIARELELLAGHISEGNPADLGGVEIGALSEILGSESLRIPNEDWLLEMIFTLGPRYSMLLREVRFEYLSPSSIDWFFERVCFDSLDSVVWERLQIRCRHRIVYDRKEMMLNRFTRWVTRSADSQLPFSGLISRLRDICGGNVHTKGVVDITCSSTERNQCWQVVDYAWDNYWHSANQANSWIQFDFKDRVVLLTQYSLKSHPGACAWFLQWTLSGSSDGNSWTVLDRRNTRELCGSAMTKIFECQEGATSREFYRYLRFTNTGKNSSDQDYFLLTNIEFFGSMKNSGFPPGIFPGPISCDS
jgi:hypothetical protein